jgi:regulator of replication initiation timing
LNPIKLKKMQDRCQQLEQQIERVESEIAGYEAELANFVSAEESLRVSNLLEKSRAELAKHLAEWEQVSELVESQQA